MKSSLMKWMLGLFLVTSVSSSTGCVSRPPVTPDTSWVKPIHFHDETLAWLKAIPDWPDTAYEDFDAIAKHNEKYERINAAR